ncbi:unnamed protein product [Pedinophyceae sp. YPF-701]|nr:unnamed protein product [Pedinophyceae sp. YPF-701]
MMNSSCHSGAGATGCACRTPARSTSARVGLTACRRAVDTGRQGRAQVRSHRSLRAVRRASGNDLAGASADDAFEEAFMAALDDIQRGEAPGTTPRGAGPAGARRGRKGGAGRRRRGSSADAADQARIRSSAGRGAASVASGQYLGDLVAGGPALEDDIDDDAELVAFAADPDVEEVDLEAMWGELPRRSSGARSSGAAPRDAVGGGRETVWQVEDEEGYFVGGNEDSEDEDALSDDDESEDEDGEPARASTSVEVRAYDTATVFVKSGDGGNGCVAFRREKFVPRGGPSGGSGGRGGHVWVVGDSSMSSLLPFRRSVHFRAQAGGAGRGADCHGQNGRDVEVRVPLGTVIRRKGDPSGAPAVAEILKDGERALLCAGGRGGRGNATFKTGRNRAPMMAERGEPGTEMWLSLELKVLADVGIVGVPNAGKSTLLSVLSAAKPKIADYPFTTLTPNLGVCEMDFETTVFADVPGLLEGAHRGVGLGQGFLRHTERCRALVHVVDGSSKDPVHDFDMINLELKMFNPELADKPQVVVYNKMDIPESSDYYDLVCEEFRARGLPDPLPISAATGRGAKELVRAVRAVLAEAGERDLEAERTVENVTEAPKRKSVARIDDFEVARDTSTGAPVWYVSGEAIETFTQMTNFDYFESLRRFQAVLEASGIARALETEGVREGEAVVIGELEFSWSFDRSEGAMYEKWRETQDKPGKAQVGSARWPSATGTWDGRK